MKKLDRFLSEHIVKVFIIANLIIAMIFSITIKMKSKSIISMYPNLESEINGIFRLSIVLGILFTTLGIAFILFVESMVGKFTNRACSVIDDIMNQKEDIDFETDEETLMSKLEYKLKQLIEVMKNHKEKYLTEHDNIKSLISDISHQIKTPIANISMYNETLIERDLPRDKSLMCLNSMKSQVNKLQWLVEALIKMSRLENGVIALNKNKTTLIETIANALSGVYIKAEKKNIEISVECDENLILNHDSKWTSEALFNILDNGVKYTNEAGYINVRVEKWDIFTKIDIEDNGIGIEEHEINHIFKRFYRASEVNNVEGIGIGLYLAREIIVSQGGYIKVKSRKGQGATFSIFLPN